MSTFAKRSTVYFDPVIHRALRLKSAETDRSISDLVNDAVKASLAEDAEDLAAFDRKMAGFCPSCGLLFLFDSGSEVMGIVGLPRLVEQPALP